MNNKVSSRRQDPFCTFGDNIILPRPFSTKGFWRSSIAFSRKRLTWWAIIQVVGGKAIGFLDVMVDLKPGKRSSPTLQKEIEGSLLFVYYHFCQNHLDNLTSSEFIENINHVETICKNNSNLVVLQIQGLAQLMVFFPS